MIALKYLHVPCVDCFKKLPPVEQAKYANNWSDTGVCAECHRLYCGNPKCHRVLRRKDLADYVSVINQDDGSKTMTCDYCKTEHEFLPDRQPHLNGYRLPGSAEWKAV